MFWKRKKKSSVIGIADQIVSASEKERISTAFNLGRIATDRILSGKELKLARDAASEAIKIFKTLPGREMDIAKCGGLLGDALAGLKKFSEASESYLTAISYAKKADPNSPILQCKLWIDCGFAQVDEGSRSKARSSWEQAAKLCKSIEETNNTLIGTDESNIAEFQRVKKRIEEYAHRINDLHFKIES